MRGVKTTICLLTAIASLSLGCSKPIENDGTLFLTRNKIVETEGEYIGNLGHNLSSFGWPRYHDEFFSGGMPGLYLIDDLSKPDRRYLVHFPEKVIDDVLEANLDFDEWFEVVEKYADGIELDEKDQKILDDHYH